MAISLDDRAGSEPALAMRDSHSATFRSLSIGSRLQQNLQLQEMMKARADVPPRPLWLAVTRSESSLTVSLSDLRSVALVGSVSPRAEALTGATTKRDFAATGGSSAVSNGQQIFEELLPARIRAALRSSPPRDLALQLHKSLAGIAWEAAFDGSQFLGIKFTMSRHIIDDDTAAPSLSWQPAADVCRVLVISHDDSPTPTPSYRDRLLDSLRGFTALQSTTADLSDMGSDDLQDLINRSDIVHFIDSGGAARLPMSDIATLQRPPRLIVHDRLSSSAESAADSEGYARSCIEALRTGLNVLVRWLPSVEAGSAEFFNDFYRQIAAGKRFAGAAQSARALSHQRLDHQFADDLQTVYCGDSQVSALNAVPDIAKYDSLRQVTTLSHDLVDSTNLIARLGAEEYTELLGRYHQRCALIVRQHGGISDDPQGDDGIMCYFGVHIAEEDAGAQSIRAALKIVEAMTELGVGVRVGISTGRVVIRSGQPVGVAVHVAARLQSIAQPGTIVVNDSTQRLSQLRFEFESLAAPLNLKGVGDPLTAYRVVRELPFSVSDFVGSKLTPLVGRERESSTLEEHWQAACRSAAKAVVISGEAGIGKSRLVREFRNSLMTRGVPIVECRCSPRHTSSAFYPIIGWLRRSLQMQDDEPAAENFRRIEASEINALAISGGAIAIATLLSIPLDGLVRVPKRSAEKQRQLTLDVLVRWMVRTLQATPLCLIVEDVQWLDPSSGEFLDRLMEAASALPLLALLTLRREAT